MTSTIQTSPVLSNTTPAKAVGDPPFVLWRDFKPRDGGVLDLIDDILAHLVHKRLRIIWVRSAVTEYPLDGGESRSFEFAYRNSVTRLVIARMAVLFEGERDPIYPYRGKGSFIDPRWPHIRFHVDFSNTPAEQRLELTPVFTSEPS